MSVYTTSADIEYLDQICLSELGDVQQITAVLAANPGLADLGPSLPRDTVITLPSVPDPVQTGQLRLWGTT